MFPVVALPKLQEPRHICATGPVERAAGRTGSLGRQPLEGGSLVVDLEQELRLVAFEVNSVGDSDHQHGTLDDLGLRTEFGDGQRLGDVAEGILPRAGQRDRGRDRQYEGAKLHNSGHQAISSFDLDEHHAADTREGQATRPFRPHDWSLDEPGQAYHIGPMSPVISPDLDPHVKRPTIRLSDSREARLDYLRSTMLGYAAIAFLFAISAATFYAAAVRLPVVQQASIDAEGV